MFLVNNSLSGRWLFLASRLTIVSLDKGTRIAALAEVEEPDSSVHVSTVQETEGVSPQVEVALWELVKETSLGAEEQDKLFVLLMDYADIFATNKDQLGRNDVLQRRIYTGDTPHTYLPAISSNVSTKEAGIASITGGDIK